MALSLTWFGLDGESSALSEANARGKPPERLVIAPVWIGVFSTLSSLFIDICGSLLHASKALTNVDCLVSFCWLKDSPLN